jgi:hypothetical protein
MITRITLAIIAILLLATVGCRTGEHNTVDLPIYERMPGLLTAEPELQGKLLTDEAGNIVVEFEKGTMFLHLALGMDPITGKEAISMAFQIFHDQYMNTPENIKKDGSFRREIIFMKAYIEETELYVIEWDLAEDNPNVKNDRYGNFV